MYFSEYSASGYTAVAPTGTSEPLFSTFELRQVDEVLEEVAVELAVLHAWLS